MTLEELALHLNIKTRNLIVKAKIVGLNYQDPNIELATDEEKLLKVLSKMNRPEIKGYAKGLKSQSPSQILDIINNKEEKSIINKNSKDISTLILQNEFNEFKHEIATQLSVLKAATDRVKKTPNEIRSLNDDLGKISNRLKIVENNFEKMSELENRLSNFQNDLLSSVDIILSLKTKIEELSLNNQMHEYNNHVNWIKNNLTLANVNTQKLPRIRPIKVIQRDFKKLDLAYSEDLLERTATALQNGHLLLIGAPGIGKTSLLKHLYLFYYKDISEVNISYNTVVSEWDNYDMVGGKTLIANRFAPHLGIFTKEVLKCVESGKDTLFLLDELNRGRIDELFSGMMDYLGNENRNLYLKELDIVAKNITSVKVPSNIKIACAMNNFDFNFFNPISRQLKRRFGIVEFKKVDFEIELDVLRKRVNTIKVKFRKQKGIIKVDLFFSIIKTIREFENVSSIETSLFGTSYIIIALNTIETKIQNGYDIDLDNILNEKLFSAINSISPVIKERLIDEVLNKFQLNECAKKIINL